MIRQVTRAPTFRFPNRPRKFRHRTKRAVVRFHYHFLCVFLGVRLQRKRGRKGKIKHVTFLGGSLLHSSVPSFLFFFCTLECPVAHFAFRLFYVGSSHGALAEAELRNVASNSFSESRHFGALGTVSFHFLLHQQEFAVMVLTPCFFFLFRRYYDIICGVTFVQTQHCVRPFRSCQSVKRCMGLIEFCALPYSLIRTLATRDADSTAAYRYSLSFCFVSFSVSLSVATAQYFTNRCDTRS